MSQGAMQHSLAFPFSAIAGQEAAKHALLICAIDPTLGGVLIFGDRGTGKSTLVRALASLLPPQPVLGDCPYRCDPAQPSQLCPHCAAFSPSVRRKRRKVSVPVVDLPLGATEDRVVGALDLEKALTLGEKSFEPGLLARANRGFLYIDEINLLEDHLVDLLLDVAASGENVVEREGLSVRHPARFVLVGSGNPEEGELRPQLLDRFGLAVDIKTPGDARTRVEIVKRRMAFDADPAGFISRHKRKDGRIRRRILKAREILASIATPDRIMETAAALCLSLGTDGLRGELTLMRAARASAALDGMTEIVPGHVKRVAAMALRHRLRRDPMDETGSTVRVERAVAETMGA